MTTTNPRPVDSTTRACCQAIGRHTPDCHERRQSLDIPLPAGAIQARPWEDIDTEPWRIVTFVSRQVGGSEGVDLSLDAIQYADGRVGECTVRVGGVYLDSGEARELADAMIEAADELDRREKLTSLADVIKDRPEIPMPAGATRVFDWEQPSRTGHEQLSRSFAGTVRLVERLHGDPIEVRVEGVQFANGYSERKVRCHFPPGGDDVLTAAQASKLCEALFDASVEVGRMNKFDAEIIAVFEAVDDE